MKRRKIFLTAIVVKLFFCMVFFPVPAEADVFKLPLYKIAPAKTVTLKCTSAEYGISIPVAERWKVEKAVLVFGYVNSTGLLENKSRLTVKVNGYPVSQINLNPLAPEGFVKLSLPALFLEPGYNSITFEASQHYTLECEYPCASDLWTTLKLDEAYLEMEYSLRDVPLKLSALPNFLFDPKISPRGEVNIVIENTKNVDMVSIASIVASGIARRFDYKNVYFSVSSDIKPGYDNILVGKGDFVRQLLQLRGVETAEIKSPFVKIMHMPERADGSNNKGRAADRSHALIIISGANTDHIKLAAETMAIMSTAFPDTNEMMPMEFRLPDIQLYGGRLIITQDKKYTFKTLNFPSYSFKGLNPAPKEITFRLPADFLIKPNMYADLSIHFSYGAALRSDSALNISLNGKSIRAIHLNDVKGGIIEGYKLNIPTHLFKPGTNVLRFEPVMTPLVGKNCEYFQTENLFLTIYENSTLYFPAMPHFVDLPKIELFMLNGFPFTRWPDAHESMVYITNPDADTVGAMLNLIGVITQKNGYPLLEMKYTFTPPVNFKGEIIVMGDINTIPEDLKRAAPLSLTKQMTVPYPVVRSWNDESSLAFSKQISGLVPGKGAIMEFQSPYAEGRTAIVFTASSTKELLALAEAVMDPGVQAKSEGDLVLIDLDKTEYNIIAMKVGKKYFAGKSGRVSKIDMYLYSYPWLYYAALGLTILLLSLTIFFLIRRYRKRRIKGE
ncbi:MAG TPA: cellulose synthase [Nitrospiraceae bacterium]|nr:cellulose synthase [Nitrospiraceae bacterium]